MRDSTLLFGTRNVNPAWRRWLVFSTVIVIIDQVTKWMVLGRLRPGERVTVIANWFDLILAFNPGAAFSLLGDASGWQRYLFSGLAIIVSIGLIWFLRKPGSFTLHLGLAMILGGAIGNLIDRIRIGEVVDFLLLYHGTWSWPAFNAADSAITGGAALLILDSFRQQRRGDPGIDR